ncbi:hypothetical protein QWY31_00550 [Cytophagales bacterium LB-30]|uniref:YtxH domain-containing protein n=1 Tax=Shiella aurantiaca TaxID=3058365 RepID=A0ABT8F0J5_9BACT|nr:hypothetical protein [Shiella aurantiaca]MDN4163965.1 hypothetical protein [Shiella aurantiaca]
MRRKSTRRRTSAPKSKMMQWGIGAAIGLLLAVMFPKLYEGAKKVVEPITSKMK